MENTITNPENEGKKELILVDLLEGFEKELISSDEITVFLNALNPYLIDLEIRSLDPYLNLNEANLIGNKDNGKDNDADNNRFLALFIDYLLLEITDKDNFEMVQAYLNRFLKIFTDYCLNDKLIKMKMELLQNEIEKILEDLDILNKNIFCLISHLGKIQI